MTKAMKLLYYMAVLVTVEVFTDRGMRMLYLHMPSPCDVIDVCVWVEL